MDRKIYWIGGSPCSGKSSITEKLAEKYGFHYYKFDDNLERFLKIAADNGKKVCKRLKSYSIDETFLRDIEDQVNDEFSFYEEVFDIVLDELSKIENENGIIVEGAGLLPNNITKNGIDKSKYIAIVPTKDFQLQKYAERVWVSHYLAESTEPKRAYDNWMARDIEFAKIVNKQAIEYGMKVIVVDGNVSIDENYEIVKNHFNL